MPTEIKRKETFGGVEIDHIRPAIPESTPPALNIVLGFEEALKLHLSLGQALARLNSYNRSTRDGKRSGVNLSVCVCHLCCCLRFTSLVLPRYLSPLLKWIKLKQDYVDGMGE